MDSHSYNTLANDHLLSYNAIQSELEKWQRSANRENTLQRAQQTKLLTVLACLNTCTMCLQHNKQEEDSYRFSLSNESTFFCSVLFSSVHLSTLFSSPSVYSFFLFLLSAADSLFLIFLRTFFRCFSSA